MNDALVDRRVVTTCVSCGHDAFYVQKDFNRTFGLAVVVIGSATSVYFLNEGEPLYAFGALFLMAIVDLIVYLKVGEVTVCYACHAVYRGFEKNPQHEAFDLKKLEKYGGRDPRIGA